MDPLDEPMVDDSAAEPPAHWVPPIEPFDPVDSWRNRILIGAALAIVVAVLGFPLGWAWSTFAPWLPAQVSGNELLYADPEGEQRAAQESWFILLSLGLGIVLALLVWFGLRRFRGSVMVAALAIGSIATGWIAWWYGHNIGRTAAFAKARTAKDGALIKLPPDLRIKPAGNLGHWHGLPYLGGDLLYVAVGSVAVYVILVGFSSNPFLNRRRADKAQPQPVES